MKLRKISDITGHVAALPSSISCKNIASFAVSELGRIHAQLPLKELGREKSVCIFSQKRIPQGNTPMFPPEGEVALMFLKPYTGLVG